MLVAFSVAPSGQPSYPELRAGSDDASVHNAVAVAVRIVRESGLPNSTDSMFTSVVDLGHGSFIRPAGI